MATRGYQRNGQGIDAQVRQLSRLDARSVPRGGERREAGRAQLRRALEALQPGNVLTVTRLDRLARSIRDLLNTLASIADRKAGFRSLAMRGLTPPRYTAG
jgi:DNA invertase Pin-like site-specific DNA recombinase